MSLLSRKNFSSSLPPYVSEYMDAIDRTAALGLQVPFRILCAKDCVDADVALVLLLDYFDRHEPAELVGQTLAINVALIPLLLEATGVPFELTLGWIELNGIAILQHGQETVRRFLTEKLMAWQREGVPFHVWLTSPACEIVDVTFAMILGWSRHRADCSRRIIYKSVHTSRCDPIYHPTVVGEDFLRRSGALLDLG